eukprot:2249499-Prymnesium_polylepis.1
MSCRRSASPTTMGADALPLGACVPFCERWPPRIRGQQLGKPRGELDSRTEDGRLGVGDARAKVAPRSAKVMRAYGARAVSKRVQYEARSAELCILLEQRVITIDHRTEVEDDKVGEDNLALDLRRARSQPRVTHDVDVVDTESELLKLGRHVEDVVYGLRISSPAKTCDSRRRVTPKAACAPVWESGLRRKSLRT